MKCIIVLSFLLVGCGREVQKEIQYMPGETNKIESIVHEKTLSCRSTTGLELICPLDLPYKSTIQQIKLTQQLTTVSCVNNINWSINVDQEFITVKDSCQATFKIMYTIE